MMSTWGLSNAQCSFMRILTRTRLNPLHHKAKGNASRLDGVVKRILESWWGQNILYMCMKLHNIKLMKIMELQMLN